MGRDSIGIHHGNASPGKTMLHVFGKQNPAAILGGNGKNQRIPNLETMIGRQIKGRLKSRPGGIGNLEAVGPLQDAGAGHIRGTFRLAGQYPKEFAQHLNRKQNEFGRQARKQFHGSVALGGIADPFAIGKDIGVNGDSHGVRSYNSSRVQLRTPLGS